MAKVRIPKPKILAISLPALLIVAAIGWLAGTWLGDQPRWILWTVRSLIWTFGMLAIVLVMRMIKGSGAPAARAEPDPIDGLFEQATKRLNAIGVRGRRALARMPVVLVLGPRGSAKTTFVTRSDLDADLLAGNIPSGEMASPTDALNLWYRDGQVIVEAGGQMSVDQARWARLVEKLKPRQLIPALLGRSQAPRVAVVCLSVEDLTGPGGGDSNLAAARTLRARLTELAEGIGIRLPVYVVFTKTDRIGHFEEFAKNLTDNEVHELLGATLRSSADSATGSYAERETERLSRAMEELFQGLSERRLEVLNRAATTQGNGGAYEFPREFRKVSKSAVQFLIELCRPNQLRVSAFLRGFYFTGVRPVVAQDTMHQPAQVQAFNPQAASSGGATQVFRLEDLQPPSARVVAPARPGERRVPQWVFLDRILQRVVLADRVAMGITSSGIGLSVLRRASMAVGIAVFLLFGLLTVVTQRNDAKLRGETRAALEGVADLSIAPLGPTSTEQLQRLDSLRAVTAKLSEYEHEGRPWRSKIFMYSGGELFEQTRQAYFHLFRPLLFDRAFQALKADLQQLPEQPSSEQFERVYRSLKGYVEITDPLYHDSATADFFGPALTQRWLGYGSLEPATREVVERQFAFYGTELAYEGPFAVEASDQNLMNNARGFLSKNTTDEASYARLLGEWSHLPSGRLDVDRPETRGVLSSAPEVHGAYTRIGWDSVHAALSNANQTFSTHVVGLTFFQELTARGFQIDSLPGRLQTRYEQSYRDTWLRYLAETQLERRTVAEAPPWFNNLGGSRSPLIQLFAYVDSQTRVATPEIESTFAALRTVVGSDSLGQLVIQKPGQDYLVLIQGLAQAVGRLPQDPVAAGPEVQTAASKGQTFVRETAIGFPADPAPARDASSAVMVLLETPFVRARELAGQGPGLAANMKAQGFCSRWGPLVFQKFPFRRQATEDVQMADLHALFNPAGELNTFLQDVDRSGVTLTPGYSAFRTKARSIAEALYENGAASPAFRIAFQVRTFAGIERVDTRVDGQTRTFTSSQAGRQSFEWDGNRANQASIGIQAGGRANPIEYGGPWALFRVFSGARWQDLGSGRYVAAWSTGGVNLEADVYFNRAPVLDLDYLGTLACAREVAR